MSGGASSPAAYCILDEPVGDKILHFADLFHSKVYSPLPSRSGSSRSGPKVTAASGDYIGSLVGTGMKFAIVVGRFNDLVTKLLLEGALEDFQRHGVAREDVDVSLVMHF